MSENFSSKLLDIYHKLFDHFGHQNWWPGETRFEVIIGAVLTQNTNWTNVEKAIGNLKLTGILSPKKIVELPNDALSEMIRPSGYFNQKAERLKLVCTYLLERCNGDLDRFGDITTEVLREELLAIKGIGPETADSILLYAFDRPLFVVDAYTARSFQRIGLIGNNTGYSEIQSLFMDNITPDPELFNDYHAQIVNLGKHYCKSKPLCKLCPLNDICQSTEIQQ